MTDTTPTDRYGLIGRMTALPGQRQELLTILAESISEMPGCLSYIVAEDPGHPDALWITEIWESQQSHQDSLKMPEVKDAITRGRPLIASMDSHQETRPVAGTGL